jgi:hypothetical protein
VLDNRSVVMVFEQGILVLDNRSVVTALSMGISVLEVLDNRSVDRVFEPGGLGSRGVRQQSCSYGL